MANLDPVPNPETEAFVTAVQEGIEAADAKRIVPYETVREWLLSWGTPNELAAPPGR